MEPGPARALPRGSGVCGGFEGAGKARSGDQGRENGGVRDDRRGKRASQHGRRVPRGCEIALRGSHVSVESVGQFPRGSGGFREAIGRGGARERAVRVRFAGGPAAAPAEPRDVQADSLWKRGNGVRCSERVERRGLSVLQPVVTAVQRDDAAAELDSVPADRSGREGRADQQRDPREVRESAHSRVRGARERVADAGRRGGDAADQIESAAADDREESDDAWLRVGGRYDLAVLRR